MTEPIFDHDHLDVYRLAIEYTADSFGLAKRLLGLHRLARDQWLRAAQSIPRNIAEGNGKRSPNDRARFLDIAADQHWNVPRSRMFSLLRADWMRKRVGA